MHQVHDTSTSGSGLVNLSGTGFGGGIIGMNDLNSMMPLGGLVPPTAALPSSNAAVVDMLEIPGKGRCFVYFAR